MEECIEKVWAWMADNFLKLNKEKTEVLFIGSPNLLSKLQTVPLTMGTEHIQPKDVVRNIGAHMDRTLNMDQQLSQIHNIGKVRSYLNTDSALLFSPN